MPTRSFLTSLIGRFLNRHSRKDLLGRTVSRD
nr:MAG TPA: hypothetical protein [Caudoviricetes sp.]